jgi:hypothetical protein
MDEQTEKRETRCNGISMKLSQSSEPFIELKIGDLVHPSIKEYLFHPEFIHDLIKTLQVWELLDEISDTAPYEVVFKSDGGVIQVKL